MTTRLNDKDWEMLSAYMDGQVSLSERSHIDQRLKSDPEWASAYRSLVKTRAILREIPRVKRQRNYFLTPEMVRKIGWLRIIPTLNFSSAAAAIFAVLLFILDVFQTVPVMNRAIAPPAAAVAVQDSAARSAAEANVPGTSEFTLTLSPDVSKVQVQAGEAAQNQASSQATALPEANVLSTIPPEEVAIAPAAAAPAPASPQILSEPLRADQAPEGLTAPSMKAAPPESMAVPSAAQAGEVPQVESLPTLSQSIEATNQPETLQMEKAAVTATGQDTRAPIEPTELNAEKSVVSTPASPGLVKTQLPSAFPEQEITDVPTKEVPAATAAPAAGAGHIIVTPTGISNRPVERVEPLPISLVDSLIKIGWITLAVISGALALISAILKKKSLS